MQLISRSHQPVNDECRSQSRNPNGDKGEPNVKTCENRHRKFYGRHVNLLKPYSGISILFVVMILRIERLLIATKSVTKSIRLIF
jgi:hypothetical protein